RVVAARGRPGASPAARRRGPRPRGAAGRAVKTPPPLSPRGSSRPVPTLALPPRSCFVLTAGGVTYARHRSGNPPADAPPESHGRVSPGESRVPFWDDQRRDLWWGGQLVKRFRQPAVLQVPLRGAFQELGSV